MDPLQLVVGDFGLAHVLHGTSGSEALCRAFLGVIGREGLANAAGTLCEARHPCSHVSFSVTNPEPAHSMYITACIVGGSPPWLSPEDVGERCTASPAGDVYMLGGVIHEVLTGTAHGKGGSIWR
jgi:hypothetical protein